MSEARARPQRRGETLASAITEELRRAIISGQIEPGHKLRARQLAQRFGVGLSPIREALNRLSRDWLVRQTDLRGFAVASVSEAELDELMKARCWLNERALRESIAHGDDGWEENVLLSYHRLSKTPRWDAGFGSTINPAWEIAHRAFHRGLLEGCGSRWIVGFCDQLFDVADLYRQVARSTPAALERAREDDEHRPIMEAAVARNADEAARLLTEHFLRTAELCRHALRRLEIERGNGRDPN
jgi:DNA-binding GntR family transcriptional regulator